MYTRKCIKIHMLIYIRICALHLTLISVEAHKYIHVTASDYTPAYIQCTCTYVVLHGWIESAAKYIYIYIHIYISDNNYNTLLLHIIDLFDAICTKQ